MKPEHAAILDDLLSRWHSWQRACPATRGYAPRAAGFEQYRTSRQYDDTNSALDTDLDASRSAQVDFEASQMRDPYRAAIYINARNLCAGLNVWSSPRLPADETERDIVIREARVLICQRLMSAGVI